ncbi:hypothetical protein CAOG_04226 [Capsaspora owczarzaki ATCC 30864]|uniref:F-box domain-containing protein n=1 Tax=Capsaspora owczarzaki (strain ATCC 30864) TaxID=595528 RepID=A0A0D2WQU0_CAPO3|nr:hypothetical protein CAOG_04226 [Capsaspora owczarzaki ATCC 30864]KJE93433.1 hypothetical protein CAOG_004226 [Capsaspora owczarzaki ATCC 30864]|eukprot:XP_004348051.1 hypothetical protein CAOG_04226 [Capsaspora owczarzaki ATCC 30864]
MNDVPNEVLSAILDFLPARDRLQAALVSRRWRDLADDNRAWRRMCMHKWNTTEPMCWPVFDPDGGDPTLWKRLYHFERALPQPTLCIEQPCCASSVDDYLHQDITNTVTEGSASFWSSTGSDDIDSSEWLTYDLFHPLVVVRSISIEAYKADWHFGRPVYAPQRVRFSFGISRDYLHHVTQEYPVAPTTTSQVFLFDYPILANFVKVELLGRTVRQPSDSLYYTAIQVVRVGGSPINEVTDKFIALAFINHAKRIANASSIASDEIVKLSFVQDEHGTIYRDHDDDTDSSDSMAEVAWDCDRPVRVWPAAANPAPTAGPSPAQPPASRLFQKVLASFSPSGTYSFLQSQRARKHTQFTHSVWDPSGIFANIDLLGLRPATFLTVNPAHDSDEDDADEFDRFGLGDSDDDDSESYDSTMTDAEREERRTTRRAFAQFTFGTRGEEGGVLRRMLAAGLMNDLTRETARSTRGPPDPAAIRARALANIGALVQFLESAPQDDLEVPELIPPTDDEEDGALEFTPRSDRDARNALSDDASLDLTQSRDDNSPMSSYLPPPVFPSLPRPVYGSFDDDGDDADDSDLPSIGRIRI